MSYIHFIYHTFEVIKRKFFFTSVVPHFIQECPSASRIAAVRRITKYLIKRFYPRDAMLARSLRQRRVCPSVRPAARPSVRPSVCLSVCLSHAGIVPSRAKAGS